MSGRRRPRTARSARTTSWFTCPTCSAVECPPTDAASPRWRKWPSWNGGSRELACYVVEVCPGARGITWTQDVPLGGPGPSPLTALRIAADRSPPQGWRWRILREHRPRRPVVDRRLRRPRRRRRWGRGRGGATGSAGDGFDAGRQWGAGRACTGRTDGTPCGRAGGAVSAGFVRDRRPSPVVGHSVGVDRRRDRDGARHHRTGHGSDAAGGNRPRRRCGVAGGRPVPG